MELALMSAFPMAMIYAAVMDFFTMTIPNKLSLAIIAGFIVMAQIMGLDWMAVAQHIAAGLSMLAISVFMFWRGWIGGGDAKLFAAVALWLGFDHLLAYALVVAVAGGALTLMIIAFRMFPLPAIMIKQDWIARLHDQKEGVPYGIALALGGLFIYPSTAWFTGLAG